MANSIELSIIIINYNTPELTTQCIQSILKETTACFYEIILIDNASRQFVATDFLKLSPQIKIIENDSNVGFGIANNMGMNAALGNYILLLNSDTVIIDKGITKSLNFMKQNAKVDVLTCKQINKEGKALMPASFYFQNNSIFQYLIQNPLVAIVKNKLSAKKNPMLTKNTFVSSLSGAFMLLKKEVYEKTKGFDPDFFLYYEETEWCMRMKKYFKLFYLHDVNFIHLHGKSAPRLTMQKQMYLSQGLFWYKSGYFNYFIFILVSYFIYVPSWFILTIFSIKKASRKHFFNYLKIYFKLLPDYIFNIPSFNKKYSSRASSLKL